MRHRIDQINRNNQKISPQTKCPHDQNIFNRVRLATPIAPILTERLLIFDRRPSENG